LNVFENKNISDNNPFEISVCTPPGLKLSGYKEETSKKIKKSKIKIV